MNDIEMLTTNPELLSLTPERHRQMQLAPGIGAGVGGLAGGGLGALFAKLTGKVSPLMGLGMGAIGGALSGLLAGNGVNHAYTSSMTPEESAYLLAQDPSLVTTLPHVTYNGTVSY